MQQIQGRLLYSTIRLGRTHTKYFQGKCQNTTNFELRASAFGQVKPGRAHSVEMQATPASGAEAPHALKPSAREARPWMCRLRADACMSHQEQAMRRCQPQSCTISMTCLLGARHTRLALHNYMLCLWASN